MPNPKEPFQTCNMVDYPFYMPDMSKSIHVLDSQAKGAYQSFVNNFYDDEQGWLQTEDCANAMRGFQCSLVFSRCENLVDGPLPPCQTTCNQFAELCYTKERADNFKHSTCQYWPTDECTKIVLPSPPAPPLVHNGVIANMTMKIDYIGEVNFGAEHLQIEDTKMEFRLTGRNGTLTADITDTQINANVGYWFKQYSFPWVSDEGIVQARSSAIALEVKMQFDERTKQWRATVESVKIEITVDLFDTWLSWLKNYLISWWQPWINGQIEEAIKAQLVDQITAGLSFDMGMYVLDNPSAELDIAASVKFHNIYR